jgi:pimeloyl-ACP methyl ester carboxylesterase
LILFLHGACPDENLEKLKHFGPIRFALHHEDFPFIALAPASSQMWSLPKLDRLIQNVQARFRADPDRIYVTGYSNGGHAVWQLALAHPHRFAGIAPVASAGDPNQSPCLKSIPSLRCRSGRARSVGFLRPGFPVPGGKSAVLGQGQDGVAVVGELHPGDGGVEADLGAEGSGGD